MKRILPALLIVAVVALQSCSTVPDTNNPQQVAESFLQAVLDDDKEEALSHVWEDNREEFRNSLFKQDLPHGFPRTGKVEIFIKKKGDGQMAGANFTGGEKEGYGVDMRFIDGRWWVTKQ